MHLHAITQELSPQAECHDC